jgi:hypothetical protein
MNQCGRSFGIPQRRHQLRLNVFLPDSHRDNRPSSEIFLDLKLHVRLNVVELLSHEILDGIEKLFDFCTDYGLTCFCRQISPSSRA